MRLFHTKNIIDDMNSYDDEISLYTWNNYGVALANLGKTEEARNAYANAVRIDPDSEIARDNLNNIGYSREALIIAVLFRGFQAL